MVASQDQICHGLSLSRPGGFLFLVQRHEALLDEFEGCLQALTRVYATDLRLDFRGVAERAQELIGGHPNRFVAVDSAVFAEDAESRIQGENGIADPGFFQGLYTPIALRFHRLRILQEDLVHGMGFEMFARKSKGEMKCSTGGKARSFGVRS